MTILKNKKNLLIVLLIIYLVKIWIVPVVCLTNIYIKPFELEIKTSTTKKTTDIAIFFLFHLFQTGRASNQRPLLLLTLSFFAMCQVMVLTQF